MKRIYIINLLTILCLSFVSAEASTKLEKLTQIECTITPLENNKIEKLNKGSSNPHRHLKQSTSSNWSGYVAGTNLTKPEVESVTDVKGSWIIPKLTATPENTFSSAWVGIDGFGSSTVEQLGTESDWDISKGKQINYAWFEMYPNYAFEITNFPVNVGDTITAEVVYKGKNTFVLSIINNTQNVYYVVPTKYTKSTKAKRLCAEWVIESPSTATVLPLCNFGTMKMFNCTAMIKGVKGVISDAHWAHDQITMQTMDGIVRAQPTELSNNGKDFSVTWHHE